MASSATTGNGVLALSPSLLGSIARRVERCGCQARIERCPHQRVVERLRLLAAPDLVERMELGQGELGVDAAAMWRMMTQKLYGSNDLVSLATREALQNGVDAIRTAYRRGQLASGQGVFSVRWEPYQDAQGKSVGKLTFEDNGIGMDLDTLRTKFLVLGASGKGGDTEAAGGFGAAKAVILGATPTGRWEVHTRGFGAKPEPGSLKYTYSTMPERRGTEIVLRDVPDERRWVKMFGDYMDVEDRVRNVLAFSDTADILLTFNGVPVASTFPKRKGSHLSDYERLDWGPGTKASVRSYIKRPGEGGNFYVRLAGLLQFAREPSYGTRIPNDIVIDLTTTARPESNEYPLNASRDQFNSYAPAHEAFDQLVEQFQRESMSAAQNPEFETLDPDSDDPDDREGADEFADAMRAVTEDPDFKATLDSLLGAVEDFYREQFALDAANQPPEGAIESHAPSPPQDADPYANFRDLADFVQSGQLQQIDVNSAEGRAQLGDVVKTFVMTVEAPGAAVGLLSDLAGALGTLQGGGDLSGAEATSLIDAVQQMNTAASPIPPTLVAGVQDAVMQAVANVADASPLVSYYEKDVIKEKVHAKAKNPFGKAGIVKISLKNYDHEIDRGPGKKPRIDRKRSKKFLKNAAKWQPYLVAWDLTTRLIAKEGRIRINFKPGFILDDTVRAMASSEGTPGRGFTNYVLVMPEQLAAVVKAHKDRPYAIASYLHHIACHELVHLPRMGQGHNEAFVVEREDLGVGTSALIPAIEQIVIKAFKLDPPLPPTVRAQVAAAKKEARAQAREKFEQRLRDSNAIVQTLRVEVDQLRGENNRLRAMTGSDREAIEDIVVRLRALEAYGDFRQFVRTQGVALLPSGLDPEAFLAMLDEQPFVAVDVILAWARAQQA